MLQGRVYPDGIWRLKNQSVCNLPSINICQYSVKLQTILCNASYKNHIGLVAAI